MALGASSAFITGCGLEMGTTDPTAREYSLDAVKQIGSGINGRDRATFTQDRYAIGPERRVLLKYEKLMERVPYVRTDSGNEVVLKVWVLGDAAAVTAARASLKVCPLTRNWMMYASWDRAHTMVGGGWTPGGEVDMEGCVSHSAPGSGDSEGLVHFKVTRWFLDYPVARDVNYGLALLSDVEVNIVGDRSGSRSPRLGWRQ